MPEFEVILSTGDRAEATSARGALVAAHTMIRDMHALGNMHKPTASFFVDGRLVRADVRIDTITANLRQSREEDQT